MCLVFNDFFWISIEQGWQSPGNKASSTYLAHLCVWPRSWHNLLSKTGWRYHILCCPDRSYNSWHSEPCHYQNSSMVITKLYDFKYWQDSSSQYLPIISLSTQTLLSLASGARKGLRILQDFGKVVCSCSTLIYNGYYKINFWVPNVPPYILTHNVELTT